MPFVDRLFYPQGKVRKHMTDVSKPTSKDRVARFCFHVAGRFLVEVRQQVCCPSTGGRENK